jgi:hypothetical protein
MFQNLSYKQKSFFLILVLALLIATATKRCFYPLFCLIKENKNLKQQQYNIKLGSEKLKNLTGEIAAMELLVGKNMSDGVNVQKSILDFIISKHQKLSITNLGQEHIWINGDMTIKTNQIELTGNLDELIGVVFECEKQFQDSRVVSSCFFLKKENEEKKILCLKIIFQNYEKNE